MLHMHFSFAIQLSSMNHNELHSFLVGDIRCRAIACKYNVDSLDVFGARMGPATSSLLLAAGAASGTLPLHNLVSSVGCVLVVQLQAFGVLHKAQLLFQSKTFRGY